MRPPAGVSPSRAGSGRAGVAVATVVLLLVALTVLAHGLLVLARTELEAGRAGLEALQARLGSEGAVRLARVAPGSWAALRDSVPIGGSRSLLTARSIPDSLGASIPGGILDASAVRLSRELWLLEGAARVGTRGRSAVARVAWLLDPIARVRSAEAVVTTGPEAGVDGIGDVLSGSYGSAPDVPPPVDCDPIVQAVRMEAVRGEPPVGVVSGGTPGRGPVGRWTSAALIATATARVDGVGTPAPATTGGVCDEADPWNWGDPGGLGRPCRPHVPVVTIADGTLVAGGAGQGVLVAEGDVVLSGVTLYGVLIAAGRVRLEDGATVTGMLSAVEGVVLAAGTRVVGSACWVAAAVAGPGLAVPFDLEASGWIRQR